MRWSTLAAALFTGLVSSACAENIVAVLSSASPEYVSSRRAADGSLIPQTFVVLKGDYIAGPTKDASIEKMPFERVLEILGPGLARQEFYPAKALKGANLVLIVSWGTASPPPAREILQTSTQILREWQNRRTTGESGGGPLPGANSTAPGGPRNPTPGEYMAAEMRQNAQFAYLEGIHEDTRTELGRQATARTLGFGGLLAQVDKEWVESTAAFTLRAMLDEERYFINVSAYDARAMVNSKQMKKLWTARLSVRSAGINFQTASQQMSAVGGDYFGKNSGNLRLAPIRIREGKIEIKDMQVVK